MQRISANDLYKNSIFYRDGHKYQVLDISRCAVRTPIYTVVFADESGNKYFEHFREEIEIQGFPRKSNGHIGRNFKNF